MYVPTYRSVLYTRVHALNTRRCYSWRVEGRRLLNLVQKLGRCVGTQQVASLRTTGTQRARDGVWKLTVNEAYLRTSNNR